MGGSSAWRDTAPTPPTGPVETQGWETSAPVPSATSPYGPGHLQVLYKKHWESFSPKKHTEIKVRKQPCTKKTQGRNKGQSATTLY